MHLSFCQSVHVSCNQINYPGFHPHQKFDAPSMTKKSASPPSPLQQLRANIREMEKLCARVRAEDAVALEALVKPIRNRASAAAQDFLLLHSSPVSTPPPQPPPAAQPSSCVSSSCHNDADVDEEPVCGKQSQLQLPEIPADQSAAESWGNLEEVRMLDGLLLLAVSSSVQTVWKSFSILDICCLKF